MCACVAALCLSLLGCVGPGTEVAPAPPTPLSERERVAELRVTLAGALDPDARAALERVEVPMLLRVSALDWFEHRSRFDRQGEVELDVEVRALSLASGLSVWLWRSLVGEDSLEVRVTLRDASGSRAVFALTERTGVGGFSWRHADLRLDRMARRLGRRIAELLLAEESDSPQSSLARSTARPTS